MRRSAMFGVGVGVIRSVVTLAVLFASVRSLVVVTLAVFSKAAPVALALTSVLPVMVITPPTLSVPTVPVNVLLVRLSFGFAPFFTLIPDWPLNFMPVGKRSLMMTFCAVDGPALVTTIV